MCNFFVQIQSYIYICLYKKNYDFFCIIETRNMNELFLVSFPQTASKCQQKCVSNMDKNLSKISCLSNCYQYFTNVTEVSPHLHMLQDNLRRRLLTKTDALLLLCASLNLFFMKTDNILDINENP